MLRLCVLAIFCVTVTFGCHMSKSCWGSGCTVSVTGANKGDTATVTVGSGGSVKSGDIWNAKITGNSGNKVQVQVTYGNFGFNVRGTTDIQVTCGSSGGGGGHGGSSGGTGGSGGGGGGGTSGGKGSQNGEGTSYGNSWQGHNCGFTEVPTKAKTYFAAINAPTWKHGANCGRCARVKCSDSRCSSGKTIDVFVTDQCPECKEGDLDLSDIGFKELTGSTPSRYHISWDWIDCRDAGFVKGNLEIYLKDGSNPYWFAFQPRNSGKPVESMTLTDASGTTKLKSPGQHSITTYYYHGTKSSGLKGPFTLTIKSTDGEKLEVKVNALWKAATSLKTNVQFK